MQPVGFLVDQYGNPLSGYGQPPSPVGGAGLDREGGEDEPWMPNAPQGSLLRHGMKGSFNRSGSDRSLRSNQSEDADSCRSRASSASSVGSHMSFRGGAASPTGPQQGATPGNVGISEGSFVRSPNGSFVRHAGNDYQPHGAAKGAMGGDGGGLGRGEEEFKDAPIAANQFRGEGRHHLMVGTTKEAAGAGAAGAGAAGYVSAIGCGRTLQAHAHTRVLYLSMGVSSANDAFFAPAARPFRGLPNPTPTAVPVCLPHRQPNHTGARTRLARFEQCAVCSL